MPAMTKPELEPPAKDEAPTGAELTDYDRLHFITYLRLLDADAERAPWEEVSRIVLRMDPAREPARARCAFDTHLARAKWMTTKGYRHLLDRARLR